MVKPAHPLVLARAARGMTGVELARQIRAAAQRRGLRSGVDKQRVRKWESGVTPGPDSQIYIAEALGIPLAAVDPDDWPNWLPGADGGVIPLVSQARCRPSERRSEPLWNDPADTS